MGVEVLYLSKEVASSTMDCDTYTPANGKSFKILEFVGDAAFDANAAVKLVWILDHATEDEDPIWTIKGSGKMPHSVEKANADGTRKLGLCLDNGLGGAIYMSGYARIWVED